MQYRTGKQHVSDSWLEISRNWVEEIPDDTDARNLW